jgi:hypothetical protein
MTLVVAAIAAGIVLALALSVGLRLRRIRRGRP